MQIKIKDVANVADSCNAWKSVIDNTDYAWYQHGYYYHKYAISFSRHAKRLLKDDSFFVYQDGKLCGLVVLVFTQSNEYSGIQCSYIAHPLPWPLIMDNIVDRDTVESFIFNEIDKRAKHAGAGKIQLCLDYPNNNIEMSKLYVNAVRRYKFIDVSYYSHCIRILHNPHDSIRKRYKRYVNNNLNKYKVRIIDNKNFYSDIANEYMKLHVKDSGMTHRPIQTYKSQLETVKNGEGFVVQVIENKNSIVVGMLVILFSNKSAYDWSVAVDPRCKNDYISHIMKWTVLSQLNNIGINYYELGKASIVADYLWQPSKKNYGISFFKDGWCRGGLKKVCMAEKYYNKNSIEKNILQKKNSLIEYLDL